MKGNIICTILIHSQSDWAHYLPGSVARFRGTKVKEAVVTLSPSVSPSIESRSLNQELERAEAGVTVWGVTTAGCRRGGDICDRSWRMMNMSLVVRGRRRNSSNRWNAMVQPSGSVRKGCTAWGKTGCAGTGVYREVVCRNWSRWKVCLCSRWRMLLWVV